LRLAVAALNSGRRALRIAIGSVVRGIGCGVFPPLAIGWRECAPSWLFWCASKRANGGWCVGGRGLARSRGCLRARVARLYPGYSRAGAQRGSRACDLLPLCRALHLEVRTP